MLNESITEVRDWHSHINILAHIWIRREPFNVPHTQHLATGQYGRLLSLWQTRDQTRQEITCPSQCECWPTWSQRDENKIKRWNYHRKCGRGWEGEFQLSYIESGGLNLGMSYFQKKTKVKLSRYVLIVEGFRYSMWLWLTLATDCFKVKDWL